MSLQWKSLSIRSGEISSQRIVLYLREFVTARVPRLIVLAVAIELFTQRLMNAPSPGLNWHSIALAFTLVLGTLLLRISDDSRDLDTDRAYFPTRPLPSGQVTLADLQVISWASIGLIIIANVLSGNGLLEVAGLLVTLFLVTRWYFMPGIISSNRFYGMLANMPFFFFLYGHVSLGSARLHDLSTPAWAPYAMPFWFLLPLFSFEVARKTCLPADERPGYQTYSSMMGLTPAIAVSFAFALTHVVLVLIPWNSVHLSPLFQVALVANALVLGARDIGFLNRYRKGKDVRTVELTLIGARYWIVALLITAAGGLL